MKQTAITAAYAAGKIQKKHYGSLLNVDEAKKNDIKLEVDRLCEEAVIKIISQAHPDHSILAEESGEGGGDSDYVWIIDPLDGTVNFFYGLPYFCTSIACYKKTTKWDSSDFPRDLSEIAEPVAAAVYNPLLDEMFSAATGEGAYLNDNKITVSSVTRLDECIIATGFGSTKWGLKKLYDSFDGLAEKVRKMRIFGAAAYDICNVAAGRLSAFTECGLRTWDIAAANIILQEAGGKMYASEYDPTRFDVVASASGVYDELKEFIIADGLHEEHRKATNSYKS